MNERCGSDERLLARQQGGGGLFVCGYVQLYMRANSAYFQKLASDVNGSIDSRVKQQRLTVATFKSNTGHESRVTSRDADKPRQG